MSVADWRPYYDATEGRPPRPTLLRALAEFAVEGRGPGLLAADLGCGIGRDVLVLLHAGWRVWALDAEATALAELKRRAAEAGLLRLEAVQGRFESTTLPACDLINASFALFACSPPLFPPVWAGIVAALKPGGRFSGQLLGRNDGWAAKPETTVIDRPLLEQMLVGLELEHLEEEEEETDGVTPFGKAKHWHIWHVNARRPS